MEEPMYTDAIEGVLKTLRSDGRKVFCTKSQVAAVVHAVDAGLCRLVPYDSARHKHKLLVPNGWSVEGNGIELTPRGEEAALQTRPVRAPRPVRRRRFRTPGTY
jgi:hypothetical protein